MKQNLFEARHQAQWQGFAEHLQALEKGTRDAAASEGFGHEYRRICQHLALARERGYSRHLVESLQQLAMRGHQQFYRHHNQSASGLLGFVVAGFPRRVRTEWRFVALAGLLFIAGLLGMGLLVYCVPELVYSVMSVEQVTDMQAMYKPDVSRLGRLAERASSEDWMMFGYYIMNNIGIAFQTFASGLLLGLGSLFFLLYNGLLIGAVAAHLTDIGSGQTFWPFVIGHGAFELTAIVLAGAAGLKLGWALLSPGRLSRGAALRVAAGHSVQLMGGVILMLLVAAFIEAYWSSMTWPAPWIKYLAGGLSWTLVAAWLLLSGRDRHATQ
ncbi:stage II sporulation protein M [Pseudomonas sp. DTU_2021_1001937_2_SI_NGA_ILE_001]|uniref:stage II sporulation protein M n=1 Tax=Pseudomonas sp. DTU_2021_1001937_2_SI_NGA_ILE_001 TaxID=3077589 RepID=UPI0028FC2D0B|nr:stage II sporulation protein M [Pseudomonas sp. DTU_2021_1001937_2_SI_NGA_ILE_001]WNW11637.1 stage II sporulation protein M [Pseudomonas sp. DTU_2021_1001937_2_SI_NGA_ILE_001]